MAFRTDIGAPGTLARTHRHDSHHDGRLAETACLRDLSFAQIVQSVNREDSNDGTHETKSALVRRGRWGRNRVRIFPDSKTGLFQIEWRENGRRLSRSLKRRDWARAKMQADQFAAGFIDAPNGKAEAKPEPLTPDRLF